MRPFVFDHFCQWEREFSPSVVSGSGSLVGQRKRKGPGVKACEKRSQKRNKSEGDREIGYAIHHVVVNQKGEGSRNAGVLSSASPSLFAPDIDFPAVLCYSIPFSSPFSPS
jgi:hypothetical protein